MDSGRAAAYGLPSVSLPRTLQVLLSSELIMLQGDKGTGFGHYGQTDSDKVAW